MMSGISILILGWKRLDKKLFLILLLLISAVVTELIDDFFSPAKSSTVLEYHSIHIYIHHVYRLAEIFFLSFYYFLLFENKRNKQLVILGSIVFILYFIYDFVLSPENFFSRKRTDLLIESMLISIYSVIYFIELYQKDSPVELKYYTHFWIVFANLIFYSTGTFFNGYLALMLTKRIPAYIQLSVIMIILNYLLYSFYIIGFLCYSTKKKLE